MTPRLRSNSAQIWSECRRCLGYLSAHECGHGHQPTRLHIDLTGTGVVERSLPPGRDW